MAHTDFSALLAWSPSGVLAVLEPNYRIVVLTASGRVRGKLPNPTGFMGCPPVWSPNGKQILVTGSSGGVWVATLSTKHWQRLKIDADGCVVGWH